MSERFELIQSLSPKQFHTNSEAVHLAAARILQDMQTKQYYLQCKFTNTAPAAVSSLEIDVHEGFSKIAHQKISNLNLLQNQTTGEKTLVLLPATEHFADLSISINTVQFCETHSVKDSPPVFSENKQEGSQPVSVKNIALTVGAVVLLWMLLQLLFGF